MSTWTLVTATLPGVPADWSPWADLFDRHGVSGTVQTDSPPTIGGYVAPGSEEGIEDLQSALVQFGAVEVTVSEVEEQDWAEAWKQFFVVRRLGQRIVVKPSWEDFSPEPGDIVLDLDPGQAFGTGDHPTTRMCLELVEKYAPGVDGVADIGCGSGILAVAALKLGATGVVAGDIDPVSVEATRENLARNGVAADQVVVGKGFDALPDHDTYNLVLSNIISAALIALTPDVARRVRPQGVWIMSGIIQANWPDVRTAAERAGFTLEDHREEGEWVAAAFRR